MPVAPALTALVFIQFLLCFGPLELSPEFRCAQLCIDRNACWICPSEDFGSSGSVASKEERLGEPVLSKDLDLASHAELRRPAVSRRDVLHELLQSLLYSEVINSALSSFIPHRPNSSQVQTPYNYSVFLILSFFLLSLTTHSLLKLRANEGIGKVFSFLLW